MLFKTVNIKELVVLGVLACVASWNNECAALYSGQLNYCAGDLETVLLHTATFA